MDCEEVSQPLTLVSSKTSTSSGSTNETRATTIASGTSNNMEVETQETRATTNASGTSNNMEVEMPETRPETQETRATTNATGTSNNMVPEGQPLTIVSSTAQPAKKVAPPSRKKTTANKAITVYA